MSARALATHSQTSGDMLADRRFDYAMLCVAERDWPAAIDLLEQAIERAPDFAPAWLELGKARLEDGQSAAAEAAFMRALACEPEDAIGAGLYLARLGQTAEMTPAYVRRLFDHYAPRFEAHLTGVLGYEAPERLFGAVTSACGDLGRVLHFARMIDLGCGTGLAGMRFAALCGRMEGCDLAPGMLAEAAAKGIYARLEQADVVAFLQTVSGPADLILAADVFPYLGDLVPVFTATKAHLAKDGVFAFSLQSQEGENFALGPDHRYAHSRAYLDAAAAAAGLVIRSCASQPFRREHGAAIPGFIVVLTHARNPDE